MEFIKGEDREQTLLLPDCIEDYIAEDNGVRVIDAFVNGLNLIELGYAKSELKDKTGRPPYDPKDMLKLYVYGYLNRIRSSRRLETESRRNLEVIWLLHKLSPDHKTIANFRKDNKKALKGVFRDFVKLCVKLDLYGKELAALDGSKFKAVNSTARNFSADRLQKLIAKIDERIDEYLKELELADAAEASVNGGKSAGEITGIVKKLNERKGRYEGYVKVLEETEEKQMSLTDPESRLMANHGSWNVCYNVQTAVDAKHKLVVDFEAGNNGNDMNCIAPMVKSVQEILEVEQITMVTDAGYDSASDIIAAQRLGADIHVAGTDFDVCVPAKAGEQIEQEPIQPHQNGRCVYIAERNIALCPMGNILYPSRHTTQKVKKGRALFRNHAACLQCACKCNVAASRRYNYEVPMAAGRFSKEYNDRDIVVKRLRIKADASLVKQRKAIAEHPFGTVKRGMDAGYCLTKGLEKATGEFSLLFLAYNMKRVFNILGCAKLLAAIA